MLGSNPQHTRAMSLILALSVVAGSWLAFEYSAHPTRPVPSVQPIPQVAEPPPQISPQAATEVSTQVPRNADMTYRCQRNGQTSFSDQPCGSNATVVSVMPGDRQASQPDDRLARMKRVAAQMETDRLAREQALNVEIATRATASESSEAAQCKIIDERIASVDARLRQPHDAQTGDYWTAERKKLMDKRFDLRC